MGIRSIKFSDSGYAEIYIEPRNEGTGDADNQKTKSLQDNQKSEVDVNNRLVIVCPCKGCENYISIVEETQKPI